MRIWLLALAPLLACGGASGTTTPEAIGRTGATPDDALRACHDQGGPNRNDYTLVANHRCPDGSTPLGGNPSAGAAARVGNVGPGPDGHVLDLYEVPCRPTPVRVYVDAYHCAGEPTGNDMNDLSEEQLANVASKIRELEADPLSRDALEMREYLLGWLESTPQVSIEICDGVVELLNVEGYRYTPLVLQQFFLSAVATVIERRGEADGATVHAGGLAGGLTLYEHLRGGQADGVSAAFDSLLRRRADGSLADEMTRLLQNCADDPPETLGFVMTRDGQNVWPPSGPECERLIACCEGRGYIQNGAAVSSEENRGRGMTCQLAGAAGDCSMALRSLAEQGEPCDDP